MLNKVPSKTKEPATNLTCLSSDQGAFWLISIGSTAACQAIIPPLTL